MSLTTLSRKVTPSAYPINEPPQPTMTFAEYARLESQAANFQTMHGFAALDGKRPDEDFIEAVRHNPGIYLSSVAELMGMNAGTVSKRLNKLAHEGRIIRKEVQKAQRRYAQFWVAE